MTNPRHPTDRAPMADAEGTIRFEVSLEPARRGVPSRVLASLAAWRSVLRRLGVVGREQDRYGNFGFGNLSARDPAEPSAFHVTATQTAGLADIGEREVTRVVEWDLRRFVLRAEGELPPSSEALTHAAVYAADASVHWIFHVHDPDTWKAAASLGLPTIPCEVGYGTPELATAVTGLVRAERRRPLVFATIGHEDGVFACGADADATGLALVAALARALARRA